MIALLTSKPISLPSLPTWQSFPPRIRRSSEPQRWSRKRRLAKAVPRFPMTDGRDGDDRDPPSAVPTGPSHWEEQRRKWTQNQVRRTESETADVYLPCTLTSGSIH